MSQEKTKDDCSRHPRIIAGLEMPELSKAIVNLHYESLQELFSLLPFDFKISGDKDFISGNHKLHFHQRMISKHLYKASHHSKALWNISKPFMDKKQ